MMTKATNNPTELALLLQFFLKSHAAGDRVFSHQPGLLIEPELFSIEKLQYHLNNPLLTPDWFQVTLAGQVLNMAESCVWKMVQRKKLMCMDKSALNEAMLKGASVILEGLDILDPDINSLCGQIDKSLPCALINCEAFFSQRNNEAYGGHRDSDNVLVVQLSGEKLWYVHQPQRRRLTGNSPLSDNEMGPLLTSFVMRKGDVLFLRAGVPHRCITHAEHSLHLSFDLCDRTPNVLDISNSANTLYMQDSVQPNVPAADIAQKYVEILSSNHFRELLQQSTAQTRALTDDMRGWIGNASSVNALNRFML